jgi:mono/diheme cytochrome c family protein
MIRHPLRLGLWFLGVSLAAPFAARATDDPDAPKLPPAAESKVDFAKDIRPIFARSCYDCHGPKKHKGGLRLDRKAEALIGGDSGPILERGKSAESRLIEFVAGVDPDLIMPPKGERLSAQEIGLLRAWIDQGASWPDTADGEAAQAKPAGQDHWAFRTPKRPTVPAVKDLAWVRNPIDAFVLARLEKEGVGPSPKAERTTLIRRLSLDLLGLPPTPAQVDQFVNDQAPGAYERLVDRTFASPHFGERWGRHWLDLARYADSDGYEKDSPRPHAWRYRNWVIDAFNRDLPFDQFTIQQLAGDLFPDATLEQKTATGFHRNTLTNREGGVDQEEFRVAAVVDRVNTTGTVWLGLTVACAQCHTHKYDPILHREYYGLFAFFNTGKEVDLPAPLPGEQEKYAVAKKAYDVEHAPLQEALEAYDKDDRPARQAEWETTVKLPSARWSVLEPAKMVSAGEATLKKQSDGSILASVIIPATDTYTIGVETDLTDITAFRVEALDDSSLPSRGPGRAKQGSFVLSEFRVKAEAKDHRDGGETRPIPLQNATADFTEEGHAAAAAIDGDPKTGWAISPQMGRRHVAVFETAEDVGYAGGTRLTFTLDQQHGAEHTLGRFRLSATTGPRPIRADGLPDDVVEILALAAEDRSEAQQKRLADYHRTIDPEWQKRNKVVAEHAKKAPAPPGSRVQALAENPDPPKTHIHIRGDFLRKGDEVQPHTLGVLHPLQPAGGTSNRLDLARWLVDPANPLTARVAVNRMWRHLFGRGIVVSADDFGTRGELPSHPELLDWLATEFIAQGWSQKAMIKEIVTSATYRQSSKHRPDLVDRDPNNVWLARQTRMRLEAELIRDVELAASGLLVPTIGGPSVHPPQPSGISDLTYAGSAKWVESKGSDRYRRGLYTWFQRTSPYPMLMTFDAPDSNVCCVRRERSNTPLQALTLLNDAVFFECAQALGRRAIEESCCDCLDERIRHAFRACLARDPSAEELTLLGRIYETLLGECKARPEDAAKLVGTAKPSGAEPAEAAAWVALARTILNLDEFVTRE